MLKKGIVSLIVVILLICGQSTNIANADQQTIMISAAKAAQTSDVVLVIDNSTSMKKTDPVNKKTGESVGTLSTKMFINSTPLNGSQIGITSFSSKLSDKRFRTESLVSVDDVSGRNKLIQCVDLIKTEGRNGGTNIPAGISAAIKMLSQSNTDNKAIILITDGQNDPERDTVDPWTNDPILRDIKTDIPIYAIGINSGVAQNKREAFKEYLNKVTKSNERVYIIDNMNKITQSIQEIDSMVFKAEEIVEFPVGDITMEMPDNVKTCAMSFVSINNKNIELYNLESPAKQNIINNKNMVYYSNNGPIANLTLTQPEKGLWKVTVKGNEEDRVRVEWKVTLEEPAQVSATITAPNNTADSTTVGDNNSFEVPWIIILVILAVLIAGIVSFILLYNPKLPPLPGYMKVCLNQPDGYTQVIQDWIDLGILKNTLKKPVTLYTITGMEELRGVRIEQGNCDYEITFKGNLPQNIYGLQSGLNTDDSLTLIYDDGKLIEFTYKSFLC